MTNQSLRKSATLSGMRMSLPKPITLRSSFYLRFGKRLKPVADSSLTSGGIAIKIVNLPLRLWRAIDRLVEMGITLLVHLARKPEQYFPGSDRVFGLGSTEQMSGMIRQSA